MVSFLDILSSHHLDPKLASGGSEIVIKCPLCDDHMARLYVNATTGMWICHRCKEAGNDYGLLREVLGLDHFVAMRLRARLDGGQVGISRPTPAYTRQQRGPSPEEAASAKEGIDLPDEYHLLTDPNAAGEGIFWRYLDSRGVTAEDVNTYRIGWCLRGRYAYRVIIPVWANGVLWTFVARSVVGAEPKVLHAEGAKPGRVLFGLDQYRGGNEAIIVEGAFDALRLGKTALATLGTNFSQEQRQLLHDRNITKVILLWDGDEVGRHAAALVSGRLVAAGIRTTVAVLPNGMDPASASDADIQIAMERRITPSALLSNVLFADRLDFLAAKV